ncbi:YhgE/Pip family protein [Paenibacillus sp. sptzw28]|uniref:YhgE/Pip family protein n=1 Tax=Paenibacillus sp. sptzw28 TaxID=715179 RepID=UPI00216198B5|nr:YhgE/Pip domain-containing protein [Paenibacillus sp. sptzw28]
MKGVIRKPMLLISFIAVALLPMLYSSILVAGSWDPYGKLDKLPVAVVNLDKGAKYDGKSLDVGADFVNELKKNTGFKWVFVNGEEAAKGMTDNQYYMTVTIPDNFSQKATTLMNDHPEQAEIIFEPNSDYNFVAGQIGNNAVKELRSKLSAQITEAYTRSMLGQVDKLSTGLGTAGNGADKLKDGADQLQEGLSRLKDNVAKFADGTSKLQDGMKPLLAGAGTLHTGASTVHKGASDLAAGLSQLSAAGHELEDGAVKTQQGASELEKGLQSSKDASGRLKAGLADSAEASGKVAGGAGQVAAGLEQLIKSDPQLEANPEALKLLAASQAVAEGSAQLAAGQQQLLAGSEKLDQGQQQLLQGASALNAGESELVDGLSRFDGKLDEAAAGGNKLAAGLGRVDQGAAAIQQGLNQVAGGIGGLTDGSRKLDAGTGQLKEGTLKLAEGTGELAGKLKDAAAQTAQVKSGNDTVNMFANPVKVVENGDRKVDRYGVGIAPYFLSLALFIGALVFTTVFPVRDSSVPGASPMGRFTSRTLTFATMSLLQSVIAGAVIIYGLGLEVRSVPLFFLYTFAASITFTFIIQAIVTWFDQPGRFIAIVLMILQLTSSAGTFPLELLPGWMQKLNPWLPMAHSITGFKAIIASGDYGLMREQLGYLAIYAVLFLVLTWVYFIRQTTDRSSFKELTV